MKEPVGEARSSREKKEWRHVLTDHELLINAYRAFNARDLETALAAMHPDVDWPNGPP